MAGQFVYFSDIVECLFVSGDSLHNRATGHAANLEMTPCLHLSKRVDKVDAVTLVRISHFNSVSCQGYQN